MSKERHQSPDSCEPSNLAYAGPCNVQMIPRPMMCNQAMPVMDTSQGTGMMPSPPNTIDNKEMYQNPPDYNPAYNSQSLSGENPPQPKFPYPEAPMGIGLMPPPAYLLNTSFPNPGQVNPAQPIVVTTQPTSTVIYTSPSYHRDYLGWSIFNIICCCFIFGLVSLIFSIKTRSSVDLGNREAARRHSCLALICNAVATILGIAVCVGAGVYYYYYYSSYTYTSTSSSSHYGSSYYG